VDEYIDVIEHCHLRDNSERKKKPVILVSSLVRNITPPVTGVSKTGGYSSWDGLIIILGRAVGSYAKGKMLRRGTIMRVRVRWRRV